MLGEDAQHFHCFQMLGQLLGRLTTSSKLLATCMRSSLRLEGTNRQSRHFMSKNFQLQPSFFQIKAKKMTKKRSL